MEVNAARPITAEKHLWYVYKGKKPYSIKDTKGQLLTLKNGAIFGIQNLNNRIDRVVVPSRPDLRYMLKVEDGGELLDVSKRHRDPVAFDPIEKPARAPKPVKVVIEKEPVAKKKADRLDAIRKAAKPSSVKSPSRADKAKLLKPKKKREDFDLDEDTFRDDDSPYDFHDFHN